MANLPDDLSPDTFNRAWDELGDMDEPLPLHYTGECGRVCPQCGRETEEYDEGEIESDPYWG